MSAEPTGETSTMSKEDVPEPMEQDISQLVPEEPTTEAPNTPAPAKQNGQEVARDPTFHDRYQELKEKELENGHLSIEEYIELFLAEVVQNLDYARHTLFRAKQRYSNESMFISIQGFLCFNYADDFSGAIKKLKAVKNRLTKFQHYLDEINNRFLAYGIASIVHCYSSIKVSTLGSILDLNNEAEMAELLKAVNWTSNNAVIQVSNTPEVQAFVKGLISPVYGSFNGIENFKIYAQLGRHQEKPIDNLKKLMMVSDQLMKINLPPVTPKGVSVDRDAREELPPQIPLFPQAAP